MKIIVNQVTLSAGLLFGATLAASAVPVTFQVDMTVPILNAAFVPGADTVQARGSFQSPVQWTGGFTLTNDPVNTNLYVGVYDDPHTSGIAEQFKFVIVKAGDPVDSWNHGESRVNGNNRTFTLAASAQTLPVLYFSDAWLGGPAVDVTFQVDMSVQIANGAFTSGGLVEARGIFQNPGWSGGFTLTNNPAAANTNIYFGTYGITNIPPGGQIEYKFVRNGTGWENINNRVVPMPATAATLPVVYFNNELPVKVPVTFQVDMAVQILIGAFDPSADTVQARGSFQTPATWTSGFTLTNDPVMTNIYVGVYDDGHAPGTVEGYKFVFVKAGDDPNSWAHQDSNDRSFTLAASAQTLPVVFFDNNSAINNFLPVDTYVTFGVSMTNAILVTNNIPFDPVTMKGVYVNGDFLGWWPWTAVPSSIAAYLLTNAPGIDQIHSTTLMIPRGTNRKLIYKYGVDNYPNPATLDDEMGFGINHVRYIRSAGSYNMPLDTFGVPVTEAEIGPMTIGPATAGRVLISWSGWPGIHLQTTASVASPVTWNDVAGTDGLSSTNYPIGSSRAFFRVIKP